MREKYYGTLQETWNIPHPGTGVEDADSKEYQDKDAIQLRPRLSCA